MKSCQNMGYESFLITNKKSFKISIEGMSCYACVRKIEKALSKVRYVDEVEVNLEMKTGKISFNGNIIPNKKKIFKKLRKMGFEGALLRKESVAENLRDQEIIAAYKLKQIRFKTLVGVCLFAYFVLVMLKLLEDTCAPESRLI